MEVLAFVIFLLEGNWLLIKKNQARPALVGSSPDVRRSSRARGRTSGQGPLKMMEAKRLWKSFLGKLGRELSLGNPELKWVTDRGNIFRYHWVLEQRREGRSKFGCRYLFGW
jgi:hypothetical protein